MSAASFNATQSVRFDLVHGAVRAGASDDRLLLVPLAALVDLADAAPPAAVEALGRALGAAIGRRAAARMGDATGTSLEGFVTQLAGEAALAGVGVLSIERWGRALVVVLEDSPLPGALVAALVGAALEAASGRKVATALLSHDARAARVLVVERRRRPARARMDGVGRVLGRRDREASRRRLLSKVVTISKLEALLSRIRTRAAEPRSRAAAGRRGAGAAPVAPPAASRARRGVAASRAVVAGPRPSSPRRRRPPSSRRACASLACARAPSPRAAAESFQMSKRRRCLLRRSSERLGRRGLRSRGRSAARRRRSRPRSSEAIGRLTDSRERLSAAPSVAVARACRGRVPARRSSASRCSPTKRRVARRRRRAEASTSDEIDETPASSRRPVAAPPEERLAELAFGSEEPQPARHTPPPKSGRLPAPPAGRVRRGRHRGPRRIAGALGRRRVGAPSPQPAEPSVLSAAGGAGGPRVRRERPRARRHRRGAGLRAGDVPGAARRDRSSS